MLRSGLFAEGWAVYTEDVMADAGYLDNDPLFRLVQLKFYLRTIANAILDQGVHVDNWTREQAMELMTQQTLPAGARSRRQVGARAADLGAAADLLRRPSSRNAKPRASGCARN